MSQRPRNLYEKIWDAHVVARREDGTCLLYIDRHLIHEVTSPQAFDGLRLRGRRVRRPDLTLAVPDHNLPTTPRVERRPAIDRRPRRGSSGAGDHRRSPFPISPIRRGRGDRPCRWPRAGSPAGHDRVAATAIPPPMEPSARCLRHRHQRGRACAGDPDAVDAAVLVDGGPRLRYARLRCRPQGPGARDHRPGRQRRRGRPRHRISRRHVRADEHRGPAHDRQHVDRGGCAIRAVRPGRDDL